MKKVYIIPETEETLVVSDNMLALSADLTDETITNSDDFGTKDNGTSWSNIWEQIVIQQSFALKKCVTPSPGVEGQVVRGDALRCAGLGGAVRQVLGEGVKCFWQKRFGGGLSCLFPGVSTKSDE